MPLPMQGKKLFPGQQNVARRRLRPGAPDRGRGDRALDPAENVAKAYAVEFGFELRPVGISFRARFVARVVPETVRDDVDQRALEFFGVGVAELGFRQFLQAVVKEPWMIERGLQDQRFAARDGGAMTAMERTCRQVRARGDITLFAKSRAPRKLTRRAARAAGLVVPRTAARPDVRRGKQAPQPGGEILPIVTAHSFVGDGPDDFRKPRLERGAPLRRLERSSFALPGPQHVGEWPAVVEHVLDRLAPAGAREIVRILPVRQRGEFETLAGLDQRQG